MKSNSNSTMIGYDQIIFNHDNEEIVVVGMNEEHSFICLSDFAHHCEISYNKTKQAYTAIKLAAAFFYKM